MSPGYTLRSLTLEILGLTPKLSGQQLVKSALRLLYLEKLPQKAVHIDQWKRTELGEGRVWVPPS